MMVLSFRMSYHFYLEFEDEFKSYVELRLNKYFIKQMEKIITYKKYANEVIIMIFIIGRFNVITI